MFRHTPAAIVVSRRLGSPRQGWIWQDSPDALPRSLASCRATTEEATRTLETKRGYFRTNAERMRYSTYRDQGLPVGSGAVKSAAKHLVQQRMKRAGMRWSELRARVPGVEVTAMLHDREQSVHQIAPGQGKLQTVLDQREAGHPVLRWYYQTSVAKQSRSPECP
jgi:hypothetical protein